MPGRQAGSSGSCAQGQPRRGTLGTNRGGAAVPMVGAGSRGSSAHGAGPTALPVPRTNEHGMTAPVGAERHPRRDRDGNEHLARYRTLAGEGSPAQGRGAGRGLRSTAVRRAPGCAAGPSAATAGPWDGGTDKAGPPDPPQCGRSKVAGLLPRSRRGGLQTSPPSGSLAPSQRPANPDPPGGRRRAEPQSPPEPPGRCPRSPRPTRRTLRRRGHAQPARSRRRQRPFPLLPAAPPRPPPSLRARHRALPGRAGGSGRAHRGAVRGGTTAPSAPPSPASLAPPPLRPAPRRHPSARLGPAGPAAAVPLREARGCHSPQRRPPAMVQPVLRAGRRPPCGGARGRAGGGAAGARGLGRDPPASGAAAPRGALSPAGAR